MKPNKAYRDLANNLYGIDDFIVHQLDTRGQREAYRAACLPRENAWFIHDRLSFERQAILILQRKEVIMLEI